MTTEAPKIEYRNPPKVCDTCQKPLKTEFFDMKTKQGSWANMCYMCAYNGPGVARLGLGWGQHYSLNVDDGKFYKIAG